MYNILRRLFSLGLLLFCSLSMLAQQPVTFTNSSSQLANIGSGGFVPDCAVDMNNDGLDDVVRVRNNGLSIDYQNAGGGFSHFLFPMNWQNFPDWSIAAGDIDGNGYNDLLFGGGSRVSFVYANSSGSAYTEDFHSQYIFSQRSTFSDIDNDGDLDAFVCHDVDESHPYENDGTGTLTLNQNLIQTADMPGNYAAQWCDFDNDGDNDMYLTKCKLGSTSGDPHRTNQLYVNNGDGTYTENAAAAGIDDNAQSWVTVWEDFDNDGDYDAFTVNHDFQNRFWDNNGNGTFTDIISTTGIDPNDLGAWEASSADFNNDGFIDIFAQLNNQFYLNNGDGTFTGASAPTNEGAIADLNNDGFLDIVNGNSLFLNNGNSNNWIKFNFVGTNSNLNGIGARVELEGAWGTQLREVRSGQTFSDMHSLQTHFGIGSATAVTKVTIKWPSGIVQVIQNPAINTAHTITEAAPVPCGDFAVIAPITDNPVMDGIHYSNGLDGTNGSIESTGFVPVSGVVEFKATDMVSLKPGFEAIMASDFRAHIENCP